MTPPGCLANDCISPSEISLGCLSPSGAATRALPPHWSNMRTANADALHSLAIVPVLRGALWRSRAKSTFVQRFTSPVSVPRSGRSRTDRVSTARCMDAAV